jgi:hypothetical protein
VFLLKNAVKKIRIEKIFYKAEKTQQEIWAFHGLD